MEGDLDGFYIVTRERFIRYGRVRAVVAEDDLPAVEADLHREARLAQHTTFLTQSHQSIRADEVGDFFLLDEFVQQLLGFHRLGSLGDDAYTVLVADVADFIVIGVLQVEGTGFGLRGLFVLVGMDDSQISTIGGLDLDGEILFVIHHNQPIAEILAEGCQRIILRRGGRGVGREGKDGNGGECNQKEKSPPVPGGGRTLALGRARRFVRRRNRHMY